MFYIYKTKNKIGCTNNINNRVIKQQGYNNYKILYKTNNIKLASIFELQLQNKYNFKQDNKNYYELITLKKRDPQLQKAYLDIRYSCYNMMHELSVLLGEDFDCWKTDCIYYRDTPKNRELVNDYFEEREMLFKQLVYNSMDAFTVSA